MIVPLLSKNAFLQEYILINVDRYAMVRIFVRNSDARYGILNFIKCKYVKETTIQNKIIVKTESNLTQPSESFALCKSFLSLINNYKMCLQR